MKNKVMKLTLLGLGFCAFSVMATAQPLKRGNTINFNDDKSAKDTIIVTPYNKSLITTGSGVKSHEQWVKFPDSSEPIRKILLRYTLATPQEDYMSCAHWDFLDQFYLRKAGGKDGKQIDFEIARVITPYGGNNHKDWSFTWELDMTDFSKVLRDSVLLDYVHYGWEPSEDRGWALTTEFIFVKGEPTMEPLAIHKMHQGTFDYGRANRGIEEDLVEKSFRTGDKTNLVKSMILQTGHGMDSMKNSEFCPKWRSVKWNGTEVDRKVLWMEGGDNPLYPQAGTWIFDRGNWIPGILINPDVQYMNVKANSDYSYDIDMEPYTISNPSATQVVCSYLVEYKVKKGANDVEIMDIISPSTKDIHNRLNPSVDEPIIVVKNHSAKAITSLDFAYELFSMNESKAQRIKSRFLQSADLVVNIPPFGVDTLRLPRITAFDAKEDALYDSFRVIILKVNGKKDSYPDDNILTSKIVTLPVHKGDMTFTIVGNKLSSKENTMVLRNVSTGEIVFNYPIGKLKDAEKVEEKLSLADGLYSFEVTDNEGDGLWFWFNGAAGRGKCYIKDNHSGSFIEHFDPDFGNTIRYQFRVNNSLKEQNIKKEPIVTVYTDKKNRAIAYDVPYKDKTVRLVIRNYTGQIIHNESGMPTGESEFLVDVSNYREGRYFVEVWQNGFKGTAAFNINK